MTLPGFSADVTLYTSTRHYRTGMPSAFAQGVELVAAIEPLDIGRPVGFPPLILGGPQPCIDWLACVRDAEHIRDLCFTQCEPCTKKEALDCLWEHQQNLEKCDSALGCPVGTTCSGDVHISNPLGYYCCPHGTVACRGQCVKNTCGPGAWFDRRICGCLCPKLCASPFVLNADKCECECPSQTCPGIKRLNPLTCECVCPKGYTDCGDGICRDLQKDGKNCGSCGSTCILGQEDCCDGVCRLLTTTDNCGFCGNTCQAGQDCCKPGRVCKELNTTLNCGACGKKCDPGEICQYGQCVCPSGRIKCGNTCCPTGQSCCGGKCTDTKTDKQNCGACGNDCSEFNLSCDKGICGCRWQIWPHGCCATDTKISAVWCAHRNNVPGSNEKCGYGCLAGWRCSTTSTSGCCPTGTIDCGTGCCPAGTSCCGTGCCPAGTTCCGTRCCRN